MRIDLFLTAGGTDPPCSLPAPRGVTEGETQNPFGTGNFVVQGGARSQCKTALVAAVIRLLPCKYVV